MIYDAYIVGAIGFEPIQTESPDLQSGPALQLRRAPILPQLLRHRYHIYPFSAQYTHITQF